LQIFVLNYEQKYKLCSRQAIVAGLDAPQF